MTTYLLTPARTLKAFILASDRAYFSRPVVVVPVYSEVGTRLVFVRDPVRDSFFPVDPKNLRTVAVNRVLCVDCGTELVKHPDEPATEPKRCSPCGRKAVR